MPPPEKPGGQGQGKRFYRSYSFAEAVSLTVASKLRDLGFLPSKSKPIVDYTRNIKGLKGRKRLSDGRIRFFLEDVPRGLASDGVNVWELGEPSQMKELVEAYESTPVVHVPLWEIVATTILAVYVHGLAPEAKLDRLIELAQDSESPDPAVAYFAQRARLLLEQIIQQGSTKETRRWLGLSNRQSVKAGQLILRARVKLSSSDLGEK